LPCPASFRSSPGRQLPKSAEGERRHFAEPVGVGRDPTVGDADRFATVRPRKAGWPVGGA
jgi:hypothetical protein